MDEILKKKIIDGMIESGIISSWNETRSVNSEFDIAAAASEDENDKGVTSDGLKYSKSAVMKYLSENGYQMTQSNIESVAKLFSERKDDGKVTVSSTRTENHNELENADADELNAYINYRILEEISKLKDQLRKEFLENYAKEYAVEVITDPKGCGTNISKLSSLLNKYSSEGWTVKTIFTNIMGQSTSPIPQFSGGTLVNSVIEEIVIVFEKPRSVNKNDIKALFH